MMKRYSTSSLPTDFNGRMYHTGLHPDEVTNNIILVGEELRATLLAEMLDPNGPKISNKSHRGFQIFTGTFKKMPVSIISIGMGTPMMDFVVRELRSVVQGPMNIVRLGTCGMLEPPPGYEESIGLLAVCGEGVVQIQRNYDHVFGVEPPEQAYHLSSKIARADPTLTSALLEIGKKLIGNRNIVSTLNLTTDSFYSSQGRKVCEDRNYFLDDNENLLEYLKKRFAPLQVPLTMEMETGHLVYLAACIKNPAWDEIKASAIHVVVANRQTDLFLSSPSERAELDQLAGSVVFNSLLQLYQALD